MIAALFFFLHFWKRETELFEWNRGRYSVCWFCNGTALHHRALHESNLFTQCYESIQTKFCRVHTWEFKLPMIWTRLSDENKNNRLPWGPQCIHTPMCDQSRCHSGKLNRGNYCSEHSNLALADTQYIHSISLIHLHSVRSGVWHYNPNKTKCICVDLAVELTYMRKFDLKKNNRKLTTKNRTLSAHWFIFVWIFERFWMLNQLKIAGFLNWERK